MKRNNIFKVLALALLLAAVLCLPAEAFSKEPASWAAEQCKHLEDVGLLGWQLSTSNRAPTDAISRGDFCQMLVNLVQMEGDWEKIGKVNPVPDGYFTDATSVSSAYGMYYGAAYGITEGTTQNGKRLADVRSNLTREMAAKMMCAAIDALETYGGVPAPQEGAGKTYTDQNSVSSWATESVARASAMGILQGDASGKFNPKGTLTWQEACVMVDRLYCSAEPVVKARRAEQGVYMMDTALELYADKYIRQTGNRLYALENNGQRSVLTINNGANQSVRLETYNADGTSAGVKTIPFELSICGGFYESADCYYLAFGDDNMEESSSKTVYRIVKYDKSWNRLGAADITNCYTTSPYNFSSHTAMAEENGTLILHTARQRYLTPSDNLRHQSNFTAKIRTSDMTVIYQSDTFDKSNYTSHSFAQYAVFDGGLPVYVDHGDAYPRGFNLSVEGGRQQNFFPFSGSTGDNTTNAVPGGLGVSGSSYLFAGASSPQQGNDDLKKANAFLAVIPKSGGQAQIKWLTSLPSDGSAFVNDVKLVEINNNTFVVMWQVTRPGKDFYKFDELQYAVFDGQGNQVGDTKSMPGYIAPSTGEDPSVYGSRILWAKAELDVSDTYSTRKSRYVQIFELNIDANSASAATTPSTGTQTTTVSTKADPNYPTTECEVNGLHITRTNVSDGAQTAYYREDWDGNWMEVSVKDDTITFSGYTQDAGYTRAVLSVVTAPSIFITKGEPFSISVQVSASDLTNGRNISVGVAGDQDVVWTTFRSGVGLKAVLDSSGKPTLQVSLPFWLKDGSSSSSSSSSSSETSTDTAPKLKYLPETLTIEVGETKDLFAYLYGASGTPASTSSNPAVATAGSTLLTGIAPGTTTLTITVTASGKVTGYGQCTVTVTGSQTTTTPTTPAASTGEVEYVNGVVCTKLPADGVVTSYREEYNGTWLQVDASGSTITYSGCGKASNAYYNYAVLRAFGVQKETPYQAGVNFSVSVTVDAAGLAAFYESTGGPSMLIAQVCQNYTPGSSSTAGYGFQSGASIAVVPDGNGGVAFRVTRR